MIRRVLQTLMLMMVVPASGWLGDRAQAATVVRAAVSQVYLGVSVHQWSSSDLLSNLASFQHDAHRNAALVMYWRDWNASGQIEPVVMNAIYGQGSAPLISWMPDCWGCSGSNPYTLDAIAAGRFDSYIRTFADSLKSYGKPVFLRFAPEMNGCWESYGCRPFSYVAAWRHLHDLFVACGATNVRWVWAPNIDWDGAHPIRVYYPGDRYVDWLGLDGYNMTWNGWNPFTQIFSRSMQELNSLNSTYPVMIAETGSSEPTTLQRAQGFTKASWILDAYTRGIPSFSRIKAVAYFNQDKSQEEGCPCDWRIESDVEATSAFAQAVAGPMYRSVYP